ncbi:uncharacterized protein LOC131472104 [Solea solea]|uniref:uncharacterized protein LOC131472104 n=1 Tax=Solea solea TaxID=90069 RepID=UPI00272B1896|nr:uncharacterized protein LOC131472104 [Solea solea]
MCRCTMFVLLLTLGIALCTGYETDDVNYGDQFRIRLSYRAHTLMFFRDGNSDGTILWSRYSSADTDRGNKIGVYYIIDKSTPQDSGRYEVRDKNGDRLSEKSISVNAITRTIQLTAHEEFGFNFNLEQDSCNIKFKPLSQYEEFVLVVRGTMRRVKYNDICEELRFSPPCEIYCKEVIKSCEGYFEVHDNDDNLAWRLELSVESPEFEAFDVNSVIFPTVIPGVIIACCCCLRRLCCKKSSKKDKPTENEPVLLRRTDFSEHSETPYPAQPNASTGPLIHNPPVNVPPAYSEVSAPRVPTHAPNVPPSYAPTVPPPYAPTVPVSWDPTVPPSDAPTVPVSFTPTVPPSSAPTVPVSYNPTAPPSFAPTVPVSFAPTLLPSSEYEPRFELKSFTLSSYSPLSSDSTEGGVYHSDKLNF